MLDAFFGRSAVLERENQDTNPKSIILNEILNENNAEYDPVVAP